MPDIRHIIGNKIREIRKNKKITIEKLAEKANLAYPNLAKIEQGKADPHLTTLERISKALKIPMTDLFLKSSSQMKYDRQKFIKKFTELSKKPEEIKQLVKYLVELENLFQ